MLNIDKQKAEGKLSQFQRNYYRADKSESDFGGKQRCEDEVLIYLIYTLSIYCEISFLLILDSMHLQHNEVFEFLSNSF